MISIGTTSKGNFLIDPSKHILVQGSSGVGKSTLLLSLFVEQVRSGNGVCLIDPHGDLADQAVKLIPRSLSRKVVWIDPDAPYVPGLNILGYKTTKERELGIESFQSMMKALAGAAWGDETARVLSNATDAVVGHYARPTAVPVFRFMGDDKFREMILKKTDSPFLRMFKQQYDEKLRESEQMSKFSPPINKLGKLMRPGVLPIVGQETGLDFLELMNNKSIVICRFSKGRLGDEVAQVLGSLVVSMISISALRREKQKERPHFMLIADEVQNFVHGGRFSSLLAEGRKYGVSVVAASQGLYQLPFAKDLFSNCSTQIAYNVSGEDAEAIAGNWLYSDMNRQLLPEHITALPRYQFYCRTFAGDEPLVAKVKCHKPAKRQGDEANPRTLIRQSLMRYAKPKREVTEKILKFLS